MEGLIATIENNELEQIEPLTKLSIDCGDIHVRGTEEGHDENLKLEELEVGNQGQLTLRYSVYTDNFNSILIDPISLKDKPYRRVIDSPIYNYEVTLMHPNDNDGSPVEGKSVVEVLVRQKKILLDQFILGRISSEVNKGMRGKNG